MSLIFSLFDFKLEEWHLKGRRGKTFLFVNYLKWERAVAMKWKLFQYRIKQSSLEVKKWSNFSVKNRKKIIIRKYITELWVSLYIWNIKNLLQFSWVKKMPGLQWKIITKAAARSSSLHLFFVYFSFSFSYLFNAIISIFFF